MNNGAMRSSVSLISAAGMAAALTACAGPSPWARDQGGPVIYPATDWAYNPDPQPVRTAAASAPITRSNADYFPEAPVSTPATTQTAMADAQSGWDFIEATGTAETAPEPEAEVAEPEVARPATTGPDLASQIYAGVLSLDLPMTNGQPGLPEGTVNISQVSFAHDGSNFDPMVSPDGKTLLFASTQHRPTADIYIQPVGSKVLTRLTDDPAQDVMPALSPDGQRVAFTSNRAGSWDIYIMAVTGGKAVQITSESANDLHPSWSPDGQQLVFCRLGETSGRWELWVVDVFNTARTQFIGYGLFPEWCPTGGTGYAGADRILFQRSRQRGQRTFSIWTLDYNHASQQASNETELVSSPAYALINPSWSPDAQRLVYAAVPNPDQWTEENRPTTASLWMIGVDGRGQVNLTNGASVDLMPTWGSNGKVFFVSDRSGIENLWGLEIAPAILAATGRTTTNPALTNQAITTAPSESD
jgi:TolB protein